MITSHKYTKLVQSCINLNVNVLLQGWIKCGSGEHRSQEMTRKIEEMVTLGYEKGGRKKRRGRKEKEEEKKNEEKRKKKR